MIFIFTSKTEQMAEKLVFIPSDMQEIYGSLTIVKGVEFNKFI